MKTQINPYLAFSGNCKEAMTFYKDCLGGELTLQVVGESPMAAQWPKEMQAAVLHATLIHESIVLLGSDMGEAGTPNAGNIISLSLHCATEAELRNYFTKLSAGGEVVKPLHEFFAGIIGNLTDKFGISWMFFFEKHT